MAKKEEPEENTIDKILDIIMPPIGIVLVFGPIYCIFHVILSVFCCMKLWVNIF